MPRPAACSKRTSIQGDRVSLLQNMESSPQRFARFGGALYLVIILFGAFSEGFVIDRLLVSSDPSINAHNIVAAAGLWNLGVAANLIVVICAVPLLWIEYLLLRPVSREWALLSVMFNIVSLSVEAVSKLYLMLVIPTLTNPAYAELATPGQLQVLAAVALRSHHLAFHICLLFFGFTCLVNGYLIARSSYFPKFVGVLLQLAGACYVVAGFTRLVLPAVADLLVPAILLPPLIGESAFCLTLLIRGVNIGQWNRRMAEVRAAG
jgi:hypothetical protein